MESTFTFPRVVVAGLSGDSGKTLISVGIARAWKRRGLRVAVFKKGPDYIDPAWLGAAASQPARNLDSFLMSPDALLASVESARGADVALIEGNRGLFDGLDAQGTHSTAELAKSLRAPLILVVDTKKSTRTVAALVLGCQALDPALPLAGVILNRVASPRQERLIRQALAQVSTVPVLGVLPRLPHEPLPARHLGLVLPAERADRERGIEDIADAVEATVDLEAIHCLADRAPRLPIPSPTSFEPRATAPVRIGVLRDEAFSFYYTENLAALEVAGAEIVPISPLRDVRLPAIDALYAGGGYPELHAEALAANVELRMSLAERIARGLPAWAECGGLMYLASGLHCRGRRHPMVGALPVDIVQTARPQGHGYMEATVDRANPYFPVGTRLRGHEFHYSRVVDERTVSDALSTTMLAVQRGTGLAGKRDGLCVGRLFASYMHLFAPGVPEWAPALVRVAREARAQAATQTHTGGHRGIHDGRRNADRNRRGRLHPGACQME
jgi:cobyrinic acid a,c-diamide synthase